MITVKEFMPAVELIMDDKGRCAGAVLYDMESEEFFTVKAKSTLIATGGYGRLPIRGYDTTNHYGATGDGVTNDRAAIQAAIDAAAAAGGGLVLFPAGNYIIGTPGLTITTSDIELRGYGTGHYHTIGSLVSATRLTCSVVGGTILTVAPVEGAGNPRVSGVKVGGIGFYGGDVVSHGLMVKSVWNGDFRGYFEGFDDAAVYVNVVTTLGEARDTQGCYFDIEADQTTVGNGPGLEIDGDATANTSFCRFNVVVSHEDAQYGVVIGNSDSNIFDDIRTGPVATANVLIKGSNDAANRVARSNYFHRVNGQIIAEGTGDKTHPSLRNYVHRYAQENGEPDPTIGTGATLHWHSDTEDYFGHVDGTFTPVLTFATPGNLNVAYSVQSGRYTLNRKQCTVHILITTSTFTHTTASGLLRITGLPFAMASGSGYAIMASGMSGYTKAGFTQISAELAAASTTLALWASGSGVTGTELAATDTPTGGTVQIWVSGQYETA